MTTTSTTVSPNNIPAPIPNYAKTSTNKYQLKNTRKFLLSPLPNNKSNGGLLPSPIKIDPELSPQQPLPIYIKGK